MSDPPPSAGVVPPAPGETPSRGVVVQVGGRRLSGAAAALVLLLFFGAIAALIAWIRPVFRGSCLWVSAALWIGFFAYWSRAAANASAAERSESRGSRALHENLLNLSLLLLFLRVPGLKGRVLPETLRSESSASWCRSPASRSRRGRAATSVDTGAARSR